MRVAIRQVPLACCAVEAATAIAGARPTIDGITWVDADPDLTVLVLAGTITHASLGKIADARAAVIGTSVTIAYGVCASSGGPYWDSYVVEPGAVVDLYVPGCPPRPEAFWGAIAQAVELAHAR